MYAGRFDGDESAKLALGPARRGYAPSVRGGVNVDGVQLAGVDALEITDSPQITIDAGRASEVLVFDLP